MNKQEEAERHECRERKTKKKRRRTKKKKGKKYNHVDVGGLVWSALVCPGLVCSASSLWVGHMFTDRTTLTYPVIVMSSVMSCLSFLSFERPPTPTLLSLFFPFSLFPPFLFTFLCSSFVNKQHRHQRIAPSFSFFSSIALSPCSLSATTTIIIIANHRSLSSIFFCLVARLLSRFSFSFPCPSFLSFLPLSYPYFFINSQE